MAKIWKPMLSAPRDGRFIICVFSDGSGVVLLYWDREDGLWREAHGAPQADLVAMGGWIPLPRSPVMYATAENGPEIDEDILSASRDNALSVIKGLESTSIRLRRKYGFPLGEFGHSEIARPPEL